MREIHTDEIISAIEELCIKSCTWLSPDMGILLECAWDAEESEAGRNAINDIVLNFKYAADSGLPICQDTGMAVVFAEVGQDVHIVGGVVADPFRRENTGDNTPAVIHTRIVPGDKISLTVAPKGFGSENMSDMKMFLPSVKLEEVEDFIVSVVDRAGSNPCPPVVLGVGFGGTVEQAALLAKKALTRSVDTRNADPFYADMETRILSKINDLGIGPQGFGGRVTAIAVNIEAFPTHIAGLPCVVNMGCHANRHASTVL